MGGDHCRLRAGDGLMHYNARVGTAVATVSTCLNHVDYRPIQLPFRGIKMTTCCVDGCDLGVRKKGMCDKHYQRVLRNGTPSLVRQPPGSLVDIGDYFTIRVNGVKKRQHVHIAETALGKPLPPNAEVHHVNGNGKDNTNSNLVICPSRAYHMMIHMRQRALERSGHADWRVCEHCKELDDPKNMSSYEKRGGITTSFYHKACAAATAARKKQKRKESEGALLDAA